MLALETFRKLRNRFVLIARELGTFGPENENESFLHNGNNAALQVSSLKGLQETSLLYACFLNHARVLAVLYKIQHL